MSNKQSEHFIESEDDRASVDEIPKKRRKGIRNDEHYKKNVIKKCRVKGAQYVNHRGRTVLARKQGAPCR